MQLERWPELMSVADELLARTDIGSAERLEAMARRSQALLGLGKFEDAEHYANSALSYYRTRPADEAIKDDFFAAACNYVLAESFRQREQALEFPQGVEAQKQVLVHRAELLLEAQREYFNTISLNNLDNYYWAAASGYRIGSMYDELWHAVMNAPVPANLPPEGHPIYHEELAKLIKPLIRHAIRYWELTQMFIERTGIQTPWAAKSRPTSSACGTCCSSNRPVRVGCRTRTRTRPAVLRRTVQPRRPPKPPGPRRAATRPTTTGGYSGRGRRTPTRDALPPARSERSGAGAFRPTSCLTAPRVGRTSTALLRAGPVVYTSVRLAHQERSGGDGSLGSARRGREEAIAGVAQSVEHLFCKQAVGGSIPLASSQDASSQSGIDGIRKTNDFRRVARAAKGSRL